MIVRWFLVAAMAAVLGGCVTTSQRDFMRPVEAPNPSSGIVWDVENRDRLFSGETEEKLFHQLLSRYIAAYRHWYADEKRVGPFPNLLNTDLLDEPGQNLPTRLRVRYDPRTGSYRCGSEPGPACASDAGLHDWAADPVRTVRLRLAGASGLCEWDIDGVASKEPCATHRSVNVDQLVAVRARPAGGGAWSEASVQVRDLRIVALGDSFSAGEGLPHTQWRYYAPVRKHPADWLDARCHRSLMSGPALTAAYLARRNPHLSVTLLHYGCSGASIADGVAAPWPMLETDEDIRRQYEQFKIEGDTFNRLEISRMIGARDVPISQIERAKADLKVGDKLSKPDVVLVSVGGNDIGFASIVHALATRWAVDPDLKPGAADDHRPYATFNQATFAAATRIVDCAELEMKRVRCMEARVRERMLGSAQNTGDNAHPTLPEQYDRLARELAPLVGQDTKRVLITQYPNFVMREPDQVPPEQATSDQAVGCVDLPLDKRAGFIPGLFASLPGLGMRRGVAEQAETGFLQPLNKTIDEAAERNHWTVVSAHVNNGRTHGYCSLQRFYNTLSDSYWFQGRRYQGTRPLGNAQLLQDRARFDLPKGAKVVWDDRRACFIKFDVAEADCLKEPIPPAPLEDLKRTAKAGQPYDKMVDHGSIWFSTGPVHPNLFGHCNYAAAIVTTIVRSPQYAGFDFDDQLKRDVANAGTDGLKADRVCDVEQGVWGWVRSPALPGPAKGR